MLKLRGSTGLHSYSAAITMSSCSCVGLAGAPSTLFHSFVTLGTTLHLSFSLMHTYVRAYKHAYGNTAMSSYNPPNPNLTT